MTYLSKTKRILLLLTIFVVLLTSCKNYGENSNNPENSEELFSSIFEGSNDESSDISFGEPDESLADNGLIDVSFVSALGGYVSGSVKQALSEGEVTKSVTAYPSLCYKFKEWSDGVTEQTRGNESFSEDTVLTAVFEYTGLPELYVEYKGGIGRSTPKDAKFTLKNASGLYEFESSTGVIQGRGNSTWRQAKKPYKIKFDESVNFLGIGSEAKRDWVIIANHDDQSLLRNYFLYNTAYKMGIGYKSTLIEVYLNGKYNGVYMLTGKVEESRLGVDVEEGGFLLELDGYAEGKEGKDYFRIEKQKYTLKSDYISSNQVQTIKKSIEEVDNAIKNGDEEKIKSLIDIDSFVDMYLLQEYAKNIDVGWSSFYMYKTETEDKLRLGPAWDFDLSMGNNYRLDRGSYENIYVGRYSGFYEQNWWFIYLCRMEWFRELVCDRWNNRFEECLENTLSQVKSYAELNRAELENNFVRWEIFGKRIFKEPIQIVNLSSYLEHFRYFVAWAELRIEWLDNCFNDNELWLKEINDRTYPKYKGGKLPEIEPDPDAPDIPPFEEPTSNPEPPISEEPSEEPTPPIDETSEDNSEEPTTSTDETSENSSEEPTPPIDETSEDSSEEPTPPIDETSEDSSEEPTPPIDETSEDSSEEPTPPIDETSEENLKELPDEKAPPDKKPKPDRK